MTRRFNQLTAILLLIICLGGCASLFEGEYYDKAEYVDDSQIEVDASGATDVKNYIGMVNAITRMVSNHQDQGELTFSNYDGDVWEDIPRACQEVQSSTAIGAYSVEYISRDARQIVSYYEADIYITYKKTEEQMDEVLKLNGSAAAKEAIHDSLIALDSGLAVHLATSSIEPEMIVDFVREVYYTSARDVIILPEVQVKSYPDTGIDRIFEIKLDYGFQRDDLGKMQAELNDKFVEIVSAVEAESDGEAALELFHLVYELSNYEPVAEGDRQDSAKRLSSTAYAAAFADKTDSEGVAMLYSALCQEQGIESKVVVGSLDSRPHSWNIIKLDEEYYHVDASQRDELGASATFLRSDADMASGYWWDKDAYPICQGYLTYYDFADAAEVMNQAEES